jgi:hypothetical protein
MPRGSKDKYTDKQKRMAEHIEEGYEDRGVSEGEAERRAWATVNKQTGGGEKPGGSGRSKSAASKTAARKSSAKNAVATKKALGTNTGRKRSASKKSSSRHEKNRGHRKSA